MADKQNPFSGFNFDQLLKPSSATKRLSYDDLGDDVQERLRAERKLDNSQNIKLKIDYSNFANHVFFDSAASKFSIAKNKILNDFVYNGSTEEKQNFELSSSAYEQYIFDQWPRNVSHASFNGSNQFISASDNNNSLLLGTSSLYVSAWTNPVITNQNIILQVASGSISAGTKYGYDFFFSGATDPHIKFSFYSASSVTSISSSYTTFTGSWNNVSVVYDRPEDIISLWINGNKKVSASVGYNSSEWKPTYVAVGSGSQFLSTVANVYNFYSGNLDEVRVQHTASELYHQRYYSRPIDSNDFVKLRYTFNEGTTGTSSVDLNVVDWSKSNLNGLFSGYNASCRVSGNVMLTDPGDPILYSFHSGVISFTSSIELSASTHDADNNNYILRLVPSGLLIEDGKQENLLEAFALVMGRYFDQLKMMVDQFSNFRSSNYTEFNETPDLFMGTVLKYFGWNATQSFDNANPLSFFFGENVLSSGSLDTTLEDVRSQFWKRILNNISYFFQSKGKRHSVDALFNVLGINRSNISLKEYGFISDKSSIETVRINKEKDVYLLGIGTGSLSSSFVKVRNLITSSNNEYTVEIITQLPYASSSFSSSVKEITGSLWQFTDRNNATGSFTLLWKRISLTSPSGAFILTGSDGNMFSTSFYPVFDGRILSVAVGLSSSQRPFIELRSIDQDIINFSASEIGAVPLTGVFTGSRYDFIVGANSGSYYSYKTHGFFGEARYWSRQLSSSEIDDHALNFESVGLNDPLETPNPLKVRIGLDENIVATSAGLVKGLTDLSNHNFVATGSQFLASASPYKKHLLSMNYISPSVDLKWNNNKIRIRNKSSLSIDEVGKDTNEVALEFNLVDALNEDISKIFINLDDFHNLIGEPVNKYRDEYVELEAYRKVYFERLSREVNFTNFFKLFRWFDQKIGTAIKQLLPIRTRFIGGEFVVESHMLERPKFQHIFPIFRTPKETGEGIINRSGSVIEFCGSIQSSLETSHPLRGSVAESSFEKDGFGQSFASYTWGFSTYESGYEYVESGYESNVSVGYGGFRRSGRDSSLVLAGVVNSGKKFKSTFSDGAEVPDRSQNVNSFYRTKYSGDQQDEINNPNVGLNWKNEWARREQIKFEGNNFDQNGDGYHSGSFIHPKIGKNAFVINSVNSSDNNEHYFGGLKKSIKIEFKFSSGTFNEANTIFALSGGNHIELSGSLYDSTNNIPLDDTTRRKLFVNKIDEIEYRRFIPIIKLEVSGTQSPSNVLTEFREGPGVNWVLFSTVKTGETKDNFTKLEGIPIPNSAFGSDEVFSLVFPYDKNGNTHLKVSSSTYDFTIRNAKMQWFEMLDNDGVEYLKNLDNQFSENNAEYIRVIMPKVE